VKCAAAVIVVRLLALRPTLDEQILPLLMSVMELLESASKRTALLILECALKIARAEELQDFRPFLDALVAQNYSYVLKEMACGECEESSSLAMDLYQLLESG
jgi:hypothetical protein